MQTAFVGTDLPLELARKRVEVIVLTGIHLDWCIEGNTRLARDNGYLPIVIGDACGCQKPEQEQAAMQCINNFFAPVISADTFVKLLSRGLTRARRGREAAARRSPALAAPDDRGHAGHAGSSNDQAQVEIVRDAARHRWIFDPRPSCNPRQAPLPQPHDNA